MKQRSVFALGLAKRTRRPWYWSVPGSAVANYSPAVVEASQSGTPLLLLTADRPAELRDCAAGQTIDQVKFFGNYVRQSTELALPELTPELLAYLRQVLVQAVECALNGNPGPVHLNFPFREPLHPQPDTDAVISAQSLERAATVIRRSCEAVTTPGVLDAVALERLSSHRRGLILVGDVNPMEGDESFADSIAMLSEKLGWPVLADVLNPVRGHASETRALVVHYDCLLRDPALSAALQATAVLQVGPLPTSKVLRRWLQESDAVAFLLSERPRNIDPLHRIATPLVGSAHALAGQLPHLEADPDWIGAWMTAERGVKALETAFNGMTQLFEGKLAWLLSHHVPIGNTVFIASSMSVRYAEYFWVAGSRACSVFANRGANGIDGTLSTALGVAHRGAPAFLLTGDLAFLHDSNGLLIATSWW